MKSSRKELITVETTPEYPNYVRIII